MNSSPLPPDGRKPVASFLRTVLARSLALLVTLSFGIFAQHAITRHRQASWHSIGVLGYIDTPQGIWVQIPARNCSSNNMRLIQLPEVPCTPTPQSVPLEDEAQEQGPLLLSSRGHAESITPDSREPLVLAKPLTEVAELLSRQLHYGSPMFGRSARWSSVRPRFYVTNSMDAVVNNWADRVEGNARTELSEMISLMSGECFGSNMFRNGDDCMEWWCEHTQVFHHRNLGAVSCVIYTTDYTTGAHPRHRIDTVTFAALADGTRQLGFKDLFDMRTDWRGSVRRLILGNLKQQGASWALDGIPSEQENERLPLWFSDDELDSIKFTLRQHSVVIHFEPYEVGTYADGVFMVVLPWSHLERWARPDLLQVLTRESDIDVGTPKSKNSAGSPEYVVINENDYR